MTRWSCETCRQLQECRTAVRQGKPFVRAVCESSRAAVHLNTQNARLIAEYFDTHEHVTARQCANELGLSYQTVRQALMRSADRGEVVYEVRPGSCTYIFRRAQC